MDVENTLRQSPTGRSLLDGSIPRFPRYTVATLPSASVNAAGVIYVLDETGGATLAQSDGTNWRRWSDGAVVS